MTLVSCAEGTVAQLAISAGNLAFFETFDDDALHCLIEETGEAVSRPLHVDLPSTGNGGIRVPAW